MTGETPHFDITISLTEAEAIALGRAWNRRQQQEYSIRGGGSGVVILLGFLTGLLAGLIAVILGEVDSATGGLVAVLGFLAFWSGIWALQLLGARVARRALRRDMDRLRRERRITIDEAGVATASLAGTSLWFWSGIQAVSDESGLILVWLEAGPLPIPRRAMAEPEALLAFLRQRLAAMAQGA